MKATHLLTLILLPFILLTAACQKDSDNETARCEFCNLVNNQSFEATSPIIDEFLATLDPAITEEEKIESLRAWMKRFDCVEDAATLCVSCIKTNPPQSELQINFLSNGMEVILILDILMDEPLKFVRFHER
jgi:hypothetical protein